MKNQTRREFIRATALATAAISIRPREFNFPQRPLLSFSTLGCPDWPFEKVLTFAKANNYDGIELRGILRELDLPKCAEVNSPENIKASKKKIIDAGLRISDLGSSCNLHFKEGPDRKKNLDEGKRFIDLAIALGCPNVRVFPNQLPKDDSRQSVIDLIIQGLQYLGDYAKNTPVSVLMESHGDAVNTDELKRIMDSAARPNVGLVWDIVNMWTITKESPSKVYGELKKYVRHTHIKDAKMVNDKPQYVLLGTGDTPIFEAIDLLYKNDYKGFYSFEWEKLWHPEIAEPEIALADFPVTMKKHFQR